jgi:hypothetical protein
VSATLAAAELTKAYRITLRAQAEAVARSLETFWRSVEPSRIDATMGRILPQVAASITGGQGRAADLSLHYLRAFVAYELSRPPAKIDVPALDVGALAGTTVTGNPVAYAVGYEPIYARKLIARGTDAAEAVTLALADVQAVSTSEMFRVAQTAMREASGAMHEVTGYRRVTGGNACPFCSMLAGRGAVYRLDTSSFLSHKHCHCTAEPVVRDVPSDRYVFAA